VLERSSSQRSSIGCFFGVSPGIFQNGQILSKSPPWSKNENQSDFSLLAGIQAKKLRLRSWHMPREGYSPGPVVFRWG